MRKVLVALGAAAALAVPVNAFAATVVDRSAFDSTFPLCNGDLIHVGGPLLVVESTTSPSSGGLITSFHFNPQGVTGVDLTTGAVFHATGMTGDVSVNSPAGGFTSTFVNQFRIQATGGSASYIVTDLFHVTITPDGTVRVSFDNFSPAC
jgi:hypothetical protein